MTASERDKVREAFTAEPGKGHLIEQALAERANLEAYGMDTGAVDGKLAGWGYGGTASAEQRKAAAAERKAATEEMGSGPGGPDRGAKDGDGDTRDGPKAKDGDDPKAAAKAEGDVKAGASVKAPPAGRTISPRSVT